MNYNKLDQKLIQFIIKDFFNRFENTNLKYIFDKNLYLYSSNNLKKYYKQNNETIDFFIENAFKWNLTDEGDNFWEDINKKYKKLLNKHKGIK